MSGAFNDLRAAVETLYAHLDGTDSAAELAQALGGDIGSPFFAHDLAAHVTALQNAVGNGLDEVLATTEAAP